MTKEYTSLTAKEIAILVEIRGYFLKEKPSETPCYWKSQQHLELYDKFFAARIQWKWEEVLSRIKHKLTENTIPDTLLDWGTGTGVAARTILSSSYGHFIKQVFLSDRSQESLNFARSSINKYHPNVNVNCVSPYWEPTTDNYVFCTSHVVTELSTSDLMHVQKLAKNSNLFLWVEPGTKAASAALIKSRDLLLESHEVISPCPHNKPCPLQNSEKDWCHCFAPFPSFVFQERDWVLALQKLHIDARSLPLSFLVMLSKNSKTHLAQKACPTILGRPRVLKAHAELYACCADGNFRTLRIEAKKFPDIFKKLRKKTHDIQEIIQDITDITDISVTY